MSDLRIVAMTALVCLGAYFPIPFPVWPFVVAVVAVRILGFQWLFIIALALAVSANSYRQWIALRHPLPLRIDDTARVVRDPVAVDRAQRVEVVVDQRRYELWVTGRLGDVVRATRAGDELRLRATSRPLSGKRAPGLRRRHIAGFLSATDVRVVAGSSGTASVANGFRTVLERSATSMPPENRALYTGLIYGDDRHQSPETVDEFRRSGLSHLTAVSGANVAFVLLLVMPLFMPFGLLGRLIGGFAVLVLFGAMTRWEPSVVRAEILAAVVMVANYLGRPLPVVRTLALALCAALVLDPFLVGSLGFLLSIAACIGMATTGEWFGARLPGGDRFRRLVGYTIAAQLFVAPVQVVVFGSVPAVGLITNLLADLPAGLVMVWGLCAGMVGGVVGVDGLATFLHLPTTLLLEWIRLVARVGALAEEGVVSRIVALTLPVLGLATWAHRVRVDGR